MTLPRQAGLEPKALYIGNGQNAFEVIVLAAQGQPSGGTLQAAWKARRGGRASPVLLVALYGEHAALCGPAGDDPPVRVGIDRGQAERLCRAALDQPDRHAALAFLAQALPSLDTPVPGLRNEGLFALHALTVDAQRRAEWAAASEKAKTIAARKGQDLLAGLGFKVERLDNLTLLLRGGERRAALAVLLDPAEIPEAGTVRFNNLSPVSYALAKADAEGLPWVVVLHGDRLRLYPTAVGTGVGRRGRTETYVEVQTSLLADEHLAYLWLLFSAEALDPKGTVTELLDASKRFAGDLAVELRERIYKEVVPRLARAIADARKLKNPSAEELDLTYRMALTVLFRLLFIAYAEDRDLLPYRTNDAYRRRSLKQKAQELAEAKAKGLPIASGNAHWEEVERLFRAVNIGNTEWGVPAYDGGLFTTDKSVSAAGAALAGLSLPDTLFEPVLEHLLLIHAPEGPLGPVDFRSLGVREFGTIYEGLLESELSVADIDLAIDDKGNYVPHQGRQTVEVPKGTIYLHNRSGARKSTGSYFTKSFAVEHLLDRALEPALDDHLERLDALDDAAATETLFDFRVADIAMGSGHFLVAAIDRIERRIADYLNRRPLPGVQRELANLREAAEKQLGPEASHVPIEDAQLLRRLIARRCIYGVDLNTLAVELARLSIWIHTFVPGLPLTVLDHHLVQGNALVGIGTIDEIRAWFEKHSTKLFPVDADNLLGQAKQPLMRLARLADASLKDVEAARRAMEEARLALAPTRALCDIIVAEPLNADIRLQPEDWDKQKHQIHASKAARLAAKELAGLYPLHFPVAFPEVFLRRRCGFDVILGNPPWQEATIEEHAFWARHFPGLRGLSQSELEREKARLQRQRPDLTKLYEREVDEMERVRATLTTGAYPGMGTGDPDLYKAFCWRFWNLTAQERGRIGVVLPRGVASAKGSELFRKAMFDGSAETNLTMLLNRGGWVFDEVEHRDTMILAAVEKGAAADPIIEVRGTFADLASFQARHDAVGTRFRKADVLSWNDAASLPLFPTEQSVEVFAQLRKAPRLDLNDGKSWRARPDTELHATAQKPLMDLKSEKCPKGFWPVYKGESFDIWTPDTGEYYAFADPEKVIPWLYAKRLRSGKSRRDSAHAEFTPAYRQNKATLACNFARIAFRDVTRATDSRTARACLVPPRVFIGNQAPYLLWPRGDERDQAFLVGVLSSIPLDWYARRFVEKHLNFFVFNPLPVPRPARDDKRWQRVVALAGRLASPDKRFAAWAKAVRVDCGPLQDGEKQDLIAELDAVVAHLYGLTEKQLVHVFETFHEGWDYAPRLGAVLKHFHTWAKRS
ncbi:Eco57I restriction-modification methylase domain-containing protein [Bradyrhizobium sp.]|uniref:Eco57I restriction-modification methylase domain-containing protein n=1 Tax=Bradyrhizobium sp. TaxID=376 RepID=UPI002D654710|nr:hypothetical protein [Bradyrhizobium sp.]HZR77002.1 hypothetical protein [Bradyrhizobium sp.]